MSASAAAAAATKASKAEFPDVLNKAPAFKGPYCVVQAIPIQPLQSRMTELITRYTRLYQNYHKDIASQADEVDIRTFFEASIQTPLPAELVYRVRNWYIMNRVAMTDEHRAALLKTFCGIVKAEHKIDMVVRQGYHPLELSATGKIQINWDRKKVVYDGDLKDLCVHVETRLRNPEYQTMTVRCAYMHKDIVQDSFHMLFELACMAFRLPMMCTYCKKVPTAPKVCKCKADCECKLGPIPIFKMCEICSSAWYCSDECKKHHAPVHMCGPATYEVVKMLHRTLLNRVVRAHAIKIHLVQETKGDIKLNAEIITFGNAPPSALGMHQLRDMILAVMGAFSDRPVVEQVPGSAAAPAKSVNIVQPPPPPPPTPPPKPDQKTPAPADHTP